MEGYIDPALVHSLQQARETLHRAAAITAPHLRRIEQIQDQIRAVADKHAAILSPLVDRHVRDVAGALNHLVGLPSRATAKPKRVAVQVRRPTEVAGGALGDPAFARRMTRMLPP